MPARAGGAGRRDLRGTARAKPIEDRRKFFAERPVAIHVSERLRDNRSHRAMRVTQGCAASLVGSLMRSSTMDESFEGAVMRGRGGVTVPRMGPGQGCRTIDR